MPLHDVMGEATLDGGNMSLGIVAALALVGAQAGVATERVFSIGGYPSDWGEEGDWVKLAELDARFTIPEGEQRETIWRVIDAASERRVAVRVRFDAVAGRLGAGNDHMVYPLCSIGVASGASFGDEAGNCPGADGATSEGERLLAVGLAQSVWRPESARRTLERALAASPPLPPRARVLALRARGQAAQHLAEDLGPDDLDFDRLWAEALADYRRALELLPDSAGPRFAVAAALVELGGYDEALAIYREIGERWPEHEFEVAVRIGAAHRNRGDYRAALQALDDYAQGQDPHGFGMKFHYHRAWTLTLLERFEEAARHVGEGLMGQPDYASAYQLRACAYARLGRLAEALEDQRRALQLLSELEVESSPGIRRVLDRVGHDVARLERAVASERNEPLAAPCEGYWDRWSHPRSRSSLIDAPS